MGTIQMEMDTKNRTPDIQRVYEEKKVSGEEAIRHIQPGQRVVVGHCGGEPKMLTRLLAEHKDWFENVEIVQMLPLGPSPFTQKGMEEHFRYHSIFVGDATREAVAEGRADYTPCFFYQVPRLFRTTLPVDVALIQVTEPDEQGYCSFGVSVDYIKAAAKQAKLVIAQVNQYIPRTLGDAFIHISEIDYIVEHHTPLTELPRPHIGKEEMEIGRYCSTLIEDGDTLQIGIGGIPEAVLASLKGKRNLGIHSEMIGESVVDLMECGVITNSRKAVNPGKVITSFLLGGKRLFDYVNNNPQIELHPIDYVNNPMVIMQHDRLVSINSCIQVDLMGQVVAESIGSMQISGVGGQVDFVRGAAMAEHGRSIIAMTSTALHGKVSKIVPYIPDGAAITTSRNDVDYVITEYGIAALRGKTLRERAESLIRVAHPKFRDDLWEEWQKKYIRQSR